MLKFLKRISKQWWLVALLVLVVCLQVMADFGLPIVIGKIIAVLQSTGQKGFPEDLVTEFYRQIIALAIFATASSGTAVLAGWLSSRITSNIVAKVRDEVFAKISSFSAAEMNKFSTSSLITRTTNDLTNISNTYNYTFRFILYGPLMAVGAITFLIIASVGQSQVWWLTLAVAAAVGLLAVFLGVVIKVAVPKFREIQKKIDKVNLVTKENLEGLRVVRAYNAEGYQREKFGNINEDLFVTDRFANRGVYMIMPGIMVIVGILSVAIAWISSFIIDKANPLDPNRFTFADMTIVSQFAMLLLIGFILMVGIFLQVPRSVVCAKRINDILETEILVKDNEQSKETNEVGTIEFRNVTFSYPGADLPVLKNISFKANKGETIAFIGATGSGKTTLVNLLPRFYDVTEGEVLIDGVNVKDYKIDDLLAKFGYVPQKAYLFHASLKDNVCLGKPDATEEELNRALEISQSSEFVSKLPHGVDYEISQGGKNVSGGQRQRLCIARAIIMKPEIFIFDDSFSALDYKTDKVLRGEIKEKCSDSTSVIVAQRVGTIIDADQIVVLENGNMVGIGKHKELLKTCDVYKEIALSQLSKEELEK